jgi:Flp pilus assembly pilin Flp
MKKHAIHFFLSDDGVTSIEYALIASVIVAAIVSTVPLIGTAVAGMFQSVVNAFP